MTNRLEDMGVSTKSWLFFSCDDCAAAREEERKKKREAMRLFSLASRASFSSFSASAPSVSCNLVSFSTAPLQTVVSYDAA